MQERLQKVIARAGIASRRHAEEFIEHGRVVVNGTCVTTLGTKVDPEKDHIRVDGKPIRQEAKKIYLLLNKPHGYITSVHDPEGRPTVMQILPRCPERLYPVGRLDFNTEGLLLLTNDGDLAHKLTHPRFGIKRRYWTKVKGCPTEAQIAKLERGGVALPMGKSAPCKIVRLPPRYASAPGQGSKQTTENSWWELVLHEGRNQEVRHLMAKIGHSVLKLKRVGFANLALGALPLGGSRFLTPREIEGLQKQVMQGPQLPSHPADKRMAPGGHGVGRMAPVNEIGRRPSRPPHRPPHVSDRDTARPRPNGDRGRGPHRPPHVLNRDTGRPRSNEGRGQGSHRPPHMLNRDSSRPRPSGDRGRDSHRHSSLITHHSSFIRPTEDRGRGPHRSPRVSHRSPAAPHPFKKGRSRH